MPTVIRLIWRFDHEVSFEYLDHLGRTLKELSESVEGFWQAASMGTLPYSLVAESRTDQLYRRISVELSNINGWIDWTSGIGIDGILKTEDFLNITRTTSSILGVTKVKRFNRAGIRFIMVCDKTVKIDRAEWTRSAIADNTYDMTTRLLGSISDIGLIFEGSDTDMLLYRVHFGPNDRNSLDRLLGGSFSPEAMVAFSDHPLIFDLDLYENAIATAGFSFARWASTKLEKAQKFADAWEKASRVEAR